MAWVVTQPTNRYSECASSKLYMYNSVVARTALFQRLSPITQSSGRHVALLTRSHLPEVLGAKSQRANVPVETVLVPSILGAAAELRWFTCSHAACDLTQTPGRRGSQAGAGIVDNIRRIATASHGRTFRLQLPTSRDCLTLAPARQLYMYNFKAPPHHGGRHQSRIHTADTSNPSAEKSNTDSA
jgi:hypothetical protein